MSDQGRLIHEHTPRIPANQRLVDGASFAGPARMTNTALAQPAAPNMPTRNPWLADGVYPTSHFNPGATDSVLHAGLAKGRNLVRDKDVKVVFERHGGPIPR